MTVVFIKLAGSAFKNDIINLITPIGLIELNQFPHFLFPSKLKNLYKYKAEIFR